jgi:hypothetical protein
MITFNQPSAEHGFQPILTLDYVDNKFIINLIEKKEKATLQINNNIWKGLSIPKYIKLEINNVDTLINYLKYFITIYREYIRIISIKIDILHINDNLNINQIDLLDIIDIIKSRIDFWTNIKLVNE